MAASGRIIFATAWMELSFAMLREAVFGEATFGLVCSWLSSSHLSQSILFASDRNLILLVIQSSSVFENDDGDEISLVSYLARSRCHALRVSQARYVSYTLSLSLFLAQTTNLALNVYYALGVYCHALGPYHALSPVLGRDGILLGRCIYPEMSISQGMCGLPVTHV